MLPMRLHAQDDKYQATRPPKRPVRKSGQTDARAYLRTVRPPDDDAAADAALRAYEQESL